MSATYPSDFDAAPFLDSVRKTVSGCQRPVTASGDDERKTTVMPASLIPGSPDVAKANVVSQIETCSPDRSIDVQPLVTKRLKEIQDPLSSAA